MKVLPNLDEAGDVDETRLAHADVEVRTPSATPVSATPLQVLNIVPLTRDLTQSHAAVSTLALVLVASLAAWGFYTSRAGEGMFRRLLAPA